MTILDSDGNPLIPTLPFARSAFARQTFTRQALTYQAFTHPALFQPTACGKSAAKRQ
jgi:hypothetical protein